VGHRWSVKIQKSYPELSQGRSSVSTYLRPFKYHLSEVDRKTFENLVEWMELYNENRHEKAVLLLVGNKVDLTTR